MTGHDMSRDDDATPLVAEASPASAAAIAPTVAIQQRPARAPREPPPADAAPTAAPSAGQTPADVAHAAPPDRRSPKLYLNRELTWLDFNYRVLQEAKDERTPLLERVKFLAIVSSNLDEFIMKRIGGLKQQVGAGVHDLTVDGRTPQQQIDECAAVIQDLHREKRQVFLALADALRANGVVLTTYEALTDTVRAAVRDDYFENIFPLVTPLAMDPAHPFPFISNLSINLLVTLHYPDEPEMIMARVKVPVGSGVPRFLRVGEGNRFIPLEEVMAHNLDLLFPGMVVDSCELFRVTRNANTERDEDQADDLVSMIESEVRDRKFAPIVRLQTVTRHRPGASGHARRRARPRRDEGCLRDRRDGRQCATSWRSPASTFRRYTIRPTTLSTMSSFRTTATSFTSSARPGRSCCSIPTSPSPPRSSGSCARRARTPRCWRSR